MWPLTACDHWCQSRLYTSQPWWHSHRHWQHSYCKPSCGGCSNSNWRRSGKDGWLHFTHSSERKDHIRRSGGDSALGLVFTESHCKGHTHTGMQKPSHDAQANFVICRFWSPIFVTETPFKTYNFIVASYEWSVSNLIAEVSEQGRVHCRLQGGGTLAPGPIGQNAHACLGWQLGDQPLLFFFRRLRKWQDSF